MADPQHFLVEIIRVGEEYDEGRKRVFLPLTEIVRIHTIQDAAVSIGFASAYILKVAGHFAPRDPIEQLCELRDLAFLNHASDHVQFAVETTPGSRLLLLLIC